MEQHISVKDFICENVDVSLQEDGTLLCCSGPEGGKLTLPSSGGKGPGGVDWTKASYLVYDLEILEDHRVRFQNQAYAVYNQKSEWPDVDIAVAAIPRYPVRISIPLSVFDTQTPRVPRTPGRLLMWVVGKPLAMQDLKTFVIAVPPCFAPIHFSLSHFYLADEEPEYLYPQQKLVDPFGQWIPKEWPGKMRSEEAVTAYLQKVYEEAERFPMRFPEDYSPYGGWKKKQFRATGFFRKEKAGGRWWLVDPEGYAFLSIGLDCMGYDRMTCVKDMEHVLAWLPPKDDPVYGEAWCGMENDCFDYPGANLIRAYGKDWFGKWAKTAKMRMLQWGFNSIGNFSDERLFPMLQMPYVCQLKAFPGTERFIYRDFPDVFSPEYQKNSENFACQLKEFQDDKYLIGYFMRNEPMWAFEETILICEEMLAHPGSFVSKDRFLAKMMEKYGAIERLNQAWNTRFDSFEDLRRPHARLASCSPAAYDDIHAFSIEMVREYVRVPALACKKADPQHLNLGMRWAMIHNTDLLAGSEYLDVFSMNRYAATPVEDIRSFEAHYDMPLLIGEFHFGALDAGLVSTGLCGVSNQLERGKAYRYYVESALAEPACVGVHYFTYNDQSSLGRAYDGEDYQIGFVDCCQQPYEQALLGVKQGNREVYAVAAGELAPTDEQAEIIPPVN